MIYFIGGSLFFGLFSGKFFWLYPLPVLAAIAGCIQIRTEIRGLKFSPTRTSFFLATATFLVWLFLVPVDPENVTVFQTSLFLQPFPITVLWLSARLFGAVIVVPLVEELAFRGAVNALLYDQLRWYWAEASARFGALILTAISFGLVHNDFLAGALAGVAFGIARWHRNELGDAVLCHALTNLMLSFYILISGEWSYWL
jgi:CAAX prenyl protease-like protein